MGEVYEAYDTVKDRVVAVKLLSEELAKDPVYQVRFRRESQAAARLAAQTHVIPIHDWGVIDGVLFIDMQLVHGVDLRTLLRTGGPLSPARAVHIVEQVASALDAAHATGLVHRDIKPANILVADKDFAYLADFGIAHTEGDAAVTVVGMAVGSYIYMAPERFDASQVDGRADIYSLACVLHEALTGASPYPAASMNVLIRSHISGPPPRPSAQRQGVPPALDEVIARGMAKDPDDRYPTAGAMAQAAKTALSGTAPRSGPKLVVRPPDPARRIPADPTVVQPAASLLPPENTGELVIHPTAPTVIRPTDLEFTPLPTQQSTPFGPPAGYPPAQSMPQVRPFPDAHLYQQTQQFPQQPSAQQYPSAPQYPPPDYPAAQQYPPAPQAQPEPERAPQHFTPEPPYAPEPQPAAEPEYPQAETPEPDAQRYQQTQQYSHQRAMPNAWQASATDPESQYSQAEVPEHDPQRFEQTRQYSDQRVTPNAWQSAAVDPEPAYSQAEVPEYDPQRFEQTRQYSDPRAAPNTWQAPAADPEPYSPAPYSSEPGPAHRVPVEPESSYGPAAYSDPGYAQPGYAGPGYSASDRGEPEYGRAGFAGAAYSDPEYSDQGYGPLEPGYGRSEYQPEYRPDYRDRDDYDDYDEPEPEADQSSRGRSIVLPMLIGVLVIVVLAVIGAIGWQVFAKRPSDTPVADSGTGGPRAVTPSQVAQPSGPPSTAPASTSATRATLPQGAKPCTQGTAPLSSSASGTTVTSCEFAEAVRKVYAESSTTTAVAGAPPRTVVATSPVTGRTYTMSCTTVGQLVTCSGGENAVVYVY